MHASGSEQGRPVSLNASTNDPALRCARVPGDMAASGSTLLLLLLAAPAGVSGGTFCDKPDPSGLGSLQAPRAPTPCFSRPSSVLEEPIIRKVCDHSGDVCFRVAAIPGAKRGPSHEVTGPAGWGEKHMLKAIYDHVLGGNCTRPNGRRKIVLDGARGHLNAPESTPPPLPLPVAHRCPRRCRVVRATDTHPHARARIVGANIGLYGLYFAARGCFVHFVEALPLNADHVQFSLSLNGFENNTKLHRIAVTAHGNRTIKMRYLPTDTGVSHAVTGSDTNGYFRDSEKNERRRAKKWIENDVSERPAYARPPAVALCSLVG